MMFDVCFFVAEYDFSLSVVACCLVGCRLHVVLLLSRAMCCSLSWLVVWVLLVVVCL